MTRPDGVPPWSKPKDFAEGACDDFGAKGGAIHFYLEDSDAETCEADEAALTSSASGCIDTCPAFDLSDSEQEPHDWEKILEMLEIEEQYRFDPDALAGMVDQGSDLECLSEYFCEAMASSLEEQVEAQASDEEPERATSSRPGWKSDRALLAATKRSLLRRAKGPEALPELGQKLKLVEDAMAEARRRHQKSVRQAVVQATQEDTPAEIVDMPAQSLLEGRIQEAVSAACTGKREKKPLGPKKRARRQVDKAMRQYVESTPLHMDMEAGEGSKWIVVGGQGTSGIIVRTGVSLKSQALHVRLTFGCWLEELSLEGNRLHFRRLRGDGPDFGWVSVELDGHRPLVRPLSAEEARALPAFRAPVMVR